MRVLMTTDAFGGVFFYSVELCAWLSAHGVSVTLATMGRELSWEQRELAHRAGANLIESRYRLEWMEEPWQDVARAGEWLLGLERFTRPDVVHLNSYAHGALPWQTPVVMVAHSCVASRWRAVLNEPTPPEHERYRERAARGLAAADVVVAPTRAMLAALGREHGALDSLRVIHHGTTTESFATSSKVTVVLSAGPLWDRAKNMQLLERAAPNVPWPIVIAGQATGPDAQTGPVLGRVGCLGVLPKADLLSWMERADIYCQPSLYEPFGLAIVEAAVRGCALVLGDIPSLRELWADAAVFVDPRNPAALADALQGLVCSPERRALLGQASREHARRYGVERMGASYLALYDELCRGRSASKASGIREMLGVWAGAFPHDGAATPVNAGDGRTLLA